MPERKITIGDIIRANKYCRNIGCRNELNDEEGIFFDGSSPIPRGFCSYMCSIVPEKEKTNRYDDKI